MKKILPIKLELLSLLLVGFLLYSVDFSIDNSSAFYFKKEDIYYEYDAAKQIQNGENPYLRILDSNMLENDKYATQLPLYFYFLTLIRILSDSDFSGFIENFRFVLFVAQLLGGVFIYLCFRRVNHKFLGFSAAVFYMFNVWSLNSLIYLKQDMIAIGLLLMSFYFLRGNTEIYHGDDSNSQRSSKEETVGVKQQKANSLQTHEIDSVRSVAVSKSNLGLIQRVRDAFKHANLRWLAYVLFGLSLGIKHIGIFVFPVYLLPLITKEDSPKVFLRNITLLGLTLLLPTLPLLIDNPLALVKSMFFSVTRAPLESNITYGYSDLLIKYNSGFNTGTLFQQMLPRLPLFVAFTLCLLTLLLKKIPISTYVFVSLLVFSIFNPVIFPQYITWVAPFALLSIIDYIKK